MAPPIDNYYIPAKRISLIYKAKHLFLIDGLHLSIYIKRIKIHVKPK